MADWDGTAYGDISELQRAMAAESLSLVSLNGNEQVLDVGCGDGYVTAQIADLLPEGSILGIDPSPRMITAARARSAPPDQGLRFETGDVTTMTFDAQFDVVVSFNALHWVHDQPAAFGRIAAALRPGGRALVVFVCSGDRRTVEQVGMIVAEDPRWSTAFNGFEAPFEHPNPDMFDAIVDTAGLRVVEKKVIDRSWDFGSREAFERWCRVGFSDWTARIPQQDVDDFIGAVVDEYEKVIGHPGRFGFMQLRASLQRA
ncbi:class I SAM-dependent methyltransferase [Aldersonia kunmingensis]|uniref:class I SAM-dependent methyltransferase n=1 Tax=Aldersonia kunmingensis TaxID=408066 RepID=UPI00082DDF32|nr:class I SAM-dependent methyltransferase [Aldersonia kunmingensis]